ncbi:hypothetical protein AADZ90_012445 [Aestuariibius sp. 2305UL40-4]|uniref:hypothetical protein n=1 Tax=Aestuariibius violaceus TaxID=3234132 RepID=UPI00345E7241
MHPPFFAVDHRVETAHLPPHERHVTRRSAPERLVIHPIGPTSGYYVVGTLSGPTFSHVARTEPDPTSDPRYVAEPGGGGLFRRLFDAFGPGRGPTRAAPR